MPDKEYHLLNRLLTISGNWKIKELQEIRQELQDQYAEERDVLLRDGISYADAFLAIIDEDFEAAYRFASPIRSRLKYKEEPWDLYDITFASTIAGYSTVLIEISDFVDKILVQIKEFSKVNKEKAEYIKISMRINVCLSLIHMKYFKLIDADDVDYAEKLFSENIAAVLSGSSKKLNIRRYYVALISKGLFFEMNDFINEGLDGLNDLGEEDLRQFMLRAIENYRLKYKAAV